MRQPISFDSSLPRAVEAVKTHLSGALASETRFVRDISGQLHVIVPDQTANEAIQALNTLLVEKLQQYAPSRQPAKRQCETLAGEALFGEPTLVSWVDDYAANVIERRAIGQDWVLQPTGNLAAHAPRFVFFSLKGGVGRSTALALWARHLTRQGKTVLVVDLDLEAPGLGAQLLETTQEPRHGVVDWLVQDLVDAPTDPIVDQMCVESPLANAGLLVVPAFGALTDQYPDNVMAKLARAYLEKEDSSTGILSFATRLRKMVEALERRYRPDVVLIDSRAGLHETVAGSLLHLDAEVLCFAVDLPVTWQGYQYLFSHLRQLAQSAQSNGSEASPQSDWRERFKMISARSSIDGATRFTANAFSLWIDTLYDAQKSDDDSLFSFDENDSEAPHYPLIIPRSDAFEQFDPLRDISKVGEQVTNAVFGEFFQGLQERLELVQNE